MTPPGPPPRPEGYGQLCAVAIALDAVGNRWSLLLLRDLARAPLRFSDLQAINPGLSPTLLTNRLRDLEASGIIERRPGPGRASLYALTEAIRPALLPVLQSVANLGAHLLEQDPPTTSPEEALAEQMRLNGNFVLARPTTLNAYVVLDLTGWLTHVVTAPGSFEATADAPQSTPDATITFFPPTTLMRVMARTQTVEEAEAAGLLAIDGNRAAATELLTLLSFADPQ